MRRTSLAPREMGLGLSEEGVLSIHHGQRALEGHFERIQLTELQRNAEWERFCTISLLRSPVNPPSRPLWCRWNSVRWALGTPWNISKNQQCRRETQSGGYLEPGLVHLLHAGWCSWKKRCWQRCLLFPACFELNSAKEDFSSCKLGLFCGAVGSY